MRRSRLRRRGALLLCAAACAASASAPASALTLEVSPADSVAGTSGAPTGTVVTIALDVGAATPMPAAIAVTVADTLAFGSPAAPACDRSLAQRDPFACPVATQVGSGTLETSAGTAAVSAYNIAGGTALALTLRGMAGWPLREGAVASLDATGRTLTLPLPATLRTTELRRLVLRLGGSDPAADWVRSTACLGGVWPVSAALLGDAGDVRASASAVAGCRPPRTAQLGAIRPRFSLIATRRSGRVGARRLRAVTLPAGLPRDATVHVRCRAGCRGAWRRAAVRGAPTTVVLGRSVIVRRRLRVEIAVASPTVRGTYLRVAFRRGRTGRITGWRGTARGCLRLGSAPSPVRCPR